MNHIHRTLIGALVALVSSPSFADNSAKPAAIPLDQSQGKSVLEATNDAAGQVLSAGSPNSRAAAGFSAANVQFTSENSDNAVSLAFSFDLESYKPSNGSGDYYSVGRTRLGIVATAPIEQGSKSAGIFSGDSVVSGSTLKLSVTHFSTKVGSGMGSFPATKYAYQQCVIDQSGRWAASNADEDGAGDNAAEYAKKVGEQLSVSSNFRKVLNDGADSKVGKFVQLACQPGMAGGKFKNTGELVDAYGDNPTAFRRKFIPANAKLRFYGLDASVGRDDHSFLDRTAFKLQSKPQTSWEVGAYYGWLNSDLTFSARGRIVYGQNYSDQDEAEICRTVSVPAGTECIKGPDGAPTRNRTGLFSFEARKLVTVNDGTTIGIAPQVTYRFEDNNVGVEVPIYLVPDKDGKLSGGIKAVYNSKDDEFAVGLFVGVPFSIFY